MIALILALALSAEFAPNATLPSTNVYVDCGGKNVSPALRWSGAPPKTRGFALTVFDPDAPGGGFWHWIAFGIPPTAHALPANSGAHAAASAKFGTNDFGHARYDGPCPPPGPAHHYVFTLYALDAGNLEIRSGGAVERALKGHVLARAQITGRYGR